MPAGELVVATRDLRSGSGTPRFCTAGCAEHLYLVSIMETLTGAEAGPGGPLDPKDTPMLAKSWKLDPGLKFMDFELAEGIQFHKGYGVMTAEDVAFSYNDANAATTPESIHGQAGDFASLIKGVTPTGPNTVRMEFTQFYSGMPTRYIGPFYQAAGITSKKAFDELGPDGMRDVFVGTGPFEMVEWRKDERIVTEAVPDHWRKTPSVKTVRILDIPEAAGRVAMLETGEAQIAGELPLKDVVRLEGQGFKLNKDNGHAREQSIMFSGNYWETTHPLTKEAVTVQPDFNMPWVGNPADPASMERARKVRWALAMTIDREGINQSILEGQGSPSYLNQISVNQAEWQDKWQVPFDPEQARQMLKEAGYENGFEMTLWVGPSGIVPELGDAIAGLWQSELNVTVNLERSVYTTFRPGLVQRSTSTPWITTGDEGRSGFPVHWPKGLQGSALTTGGWGLGFQDAKYTEFFLKMANEPDVEKRLTIADEYFDYVHNQMLQPGIVEEPYHPMYNPNEVQEWVLNPNMNSNLSGINNLESVVLAK